ncbi:MAG: ClpXP protease specificity-enhancing factor SspB [Hyphomicrobium sp.]
MTAEHTIDYEALTQDAMRSVVRAVLLRAAKTGLPGDHHFYISFDTQAPGVILSKRLKESSKYQNEMTVVLQHRFWDLAVTDERFEVKLTFDGIPERLVVPFSAIKVFFDPSVRYGLQFEEPDGADGPLDGLMAEDAQSDQPTDQPAGLDSRVTTTRSQGPRKPRAPRKSRAERELSPVTVAPAATKSPPEVHAPASSQPPPPRAVPKTLVAETTTTPSSDRSASERPADDKPAAPAQAGAQIVSLDQFRKK